MPQAVRSLASLFTIYDKVALGQIFLHALRISPASIIPPKLLNSSVFSHHS